jgi:hypothetical protein
MKNSIYLNAKSTMKSEAKKLKAQSNDKPYIRYELNNLCDDFISQFNWHAMKETISEKRFCFTQVGISENKTST